MLTSAWRALCKGLHEGGRWPRARFPGRPAGLPPLLPPPHPRPEIGPWRHVARK